MIETLAAFAGGLVLGGIFFGGLWWTLRRGLTATNPALWFSVSALLRMAIVILGLYGFARGGLGTLLSAAAGLIAVRVGMMRTMHRMA